MLAYNIRANLFFSKINASIWTPKITNEVAKAVRKATRLIPSEPCAVPSTSVLVALAELVGEVVVDMVGFCDVEAIETWESG